MPWTKEETIWNKKFNGIALPVVIGTTLVTGGLVALSYKYPRDWHKRKEHKRPIVKDEPEMVPPTTDPVINKQMDIQE